MLCGTCHLQTYRLLPSHNEQHPSLLHRRIVVLQLHGFYHARLPWHEAATGTQSGPQLDQACLQPRLVFKKHSHRCLTIKKDPQQMLYSSIWIAVKLCQFKHALVRHLRSSYWLNVQDSQHPATQEPCCYTPMKSLDSVALQIAGPQHQA